MRRVALALAITGFGAGACAPACDSGRLSSLSSPKSNTAASDGGHGGNSAQNETFLPNDARASCSSSRNFDSAGLAGIFNRLFPSGTAQMNPSRFWKEVQLIWKLIRIEY